MIRPAGVALPRGLIFITDSSSLSIWVLASALDFLDSLLILSSFIFEIRSSRAIVLRCLGMATASNTSSASDELKSILDRDRGSPFNDLSASAAPPSSTAVRPPSDVVGESMPLMVEMRRSFRSILDAKAALPSSHSCVSAFKSIPIELYWIIRFVPSSDTSSVSFRFLSDSSRSTCNFA